MDQHHAAVADYQVVRGGERSGCLVTMVPPYCRCTIAPALASPFQMERVAGYVMLALQHC